MKTIGNGVCTMMACVSLFMSGVHLKKINPSTCKKKKSILGQAVECEVHVCVSCNWCDLVCTGL